jgi:hypothetical protein
LGKVIEIKKYKDGNDTVVIFRNMDISDKLLSELFIKSLASSVNAALDNIDDSQMESLPDPVPEVLETSNDSQSSNGGPDTTIVSEEEPHDVQSFNDVPEVDIEHAVVKSFINDFNASKSLKEKQGLFNEAVKAFKEESAANSREQIFLEIREMLKAFFANAEPYEYREKLDDAQVKLFYKSYVHWLTENERRWMTEKYKVDSWASFLKCPHLKLGVGDIVRYFQNGPEEE